MCGIAGIISNNSSTALHHLKKMTDAIAHRGPDGEGLWQNAGGNVLLGHRRLSIIDLSEAAAQPMHFSKRYSIVHNGELYNYIEIKLLLEQKGYRFRTASDTEVILAAYDQWKEKCLQVFDGMFAFAIWDEKESTLFAARDRFGEKPFYYYEDGEHLLFASEMKALWAIGVDKTIDEKMLLNYLTIGQVQNPTDNAQTFYQQVYALPAAHYMKFDARERKMKIQQYWRINKEQKIDTSPAAAIEKFENLFDQSIKKRLRSDVSLGSSLSGGLDSSAIAAFVSRQPGHETALKTFSACFPGFEKDESAYINIACEGLGLQNYTVTPTAGDLLNDFEKLCYHQEEPFQSSSIYSQYKVFELAKQHGVKVLLDGQGADEVLGGYPKYIQWYLQEVLSRHRLGAIRQEKKALLKNRQPFKWGIKNHFAAFLPAHAAMQLEKREYRKTISHPQISQDFLQLVKGHEWEGIHKPIVTKLNDILYFNVAEQGLQELLRFADRNSMAHGREVRLPFLNHELVEFIFSLPASYKIHDGFSKWILRKVVDDILPKAITWRTDKVGYETPQVQWMQSPQLQDYIHESKKQLVGRGILKTSSLDKPVLPQENHAAENFDWRYCCAARMLD